MGRCRACDKVLTDFEATRKVVSKDGTVTYPDYCNDCFEHSGLDKVATVVSREDLETTEDIFEETITNDFYEGELSDR